MSIERYQKHFRSNYDTDLFPLICPLNLYESDVIGSCGATYLSIFTDQHPEPCDSITLLED